MPVRWSIDYDENTRVIEVRAQDETGGSRATFSAVDLAGKRGNGVYRALQHYLTRELHVLPPHKIISAVQALTF